MYVTDLTNCNFTVRSCFVIVIDCSHFIPCLAFYLVSVYNCCLTAVLLETLDFDLLGWYDIWTMLPVE